VAGMLRSFSYAAQMGLTTYLSRRPETPELFAKWGQLWEQSVADSFLQAYRLATRGSTFLPPDATGFKALLNGYLLEKAFYELSYELENRPAWVRIPLAGILALEI